MSKTAKGGQPVENGKLIILQSEWQVFNDNLKDAMGEVSITPRTCRKHSHPKGKQEDVMPAVEDLL